MASGVKLIDFDKEELKTHYCISNEQRDEQMEESIRRFEGRLQPGEISDEDVAIVCYGPSLMDTWEEVKRFKTVFSCSGAHQFLIDKEVIPTFHVEVDPREHKKRFIDPPHPEVEYLMASCCHPKVFDVLKDSKVKLWHVYDGSRLEDLPANYPRGDWVLTGGANVGLRALVVAYFMGYRNIHLYGMDYSFRSDGKQHAADHPKEPAPNCVVEVGSDRYLSSAPMVTYCRQFFHEVEQLPGLNLRVYGLGLLQAKIHEKMKKGPLIPFQNTTIGMLAKPTISKEAVEKQRKALKEQQGKTPKATLVENLKKSTKAETVLDYGCGNGLLARKLQFPIWEYDPAIPGKDSPPKPADLVICTNVLEEVEDDYLEPTLADLARVTKKVGYLVIDGKRDIWEQRLLEYFSVGKILQNGEELHVVVGPK